MPHIDFLDQIVEPIAAWALIKQGTVKGEGKEMPDLKLGNAISSMKSSFSYVDATVQKRIIQDALSHFPDIGVICEEKLDFDFPNHFGVLVDGKYTLIIDPIDGTRNYLAKTPGNEFHDELKDKYDLWGVSTAIAYGREIIGGVISFPALNLVLMTEKGSGTTINHQLVKLQESSYHNPSDYIKLSGVAGYSEPHLLDIFPDISGKLSNSSMVDCLSLLKGSSQVPIDGTSGILSLKAAIIRDVTAWDTGCIPLAYKEAGGIIVDESGESINPFDYITNDRSRKEIVLGKKYFMAPNKEYFNSLIEHINHPSRV
ncbi:hypothetical protein H6503_04370 [Candidatus Woesearchaeota archaeon]|nr:hypothetical protein [Candidatus Woesearchaeota archaeon]